MVRESSTPISRPLITLPTTWPRCSSLASEAAIGIRSWGTAENNPISRLARYQQPERGRVGGPDEPGRSQQNQTQHQTFPLPLVAERHNQQQAQRVAHLRDGGHQTHPAFGEAERAADFGQQWLVVVQVGHHQAAGHGHQPDLARRPAVG